MKHSLFREGGPYSIRRTGPEEHSLSTPIPADECGRIARTCPSGTCSPGYFRLKPGTGLIEGVEVAYCPYCRHAANPEEFTTEEQIRYAQDIAMREAKRGSINWSRRHSDSTRPARRSMMLDSSLSNSATNQRPVSWYAGPWRRSCEEALCARTAGLTTRCSVWRSGAGLRQGHLHGTRRCRACCCADDPGGC